MRSRLESFTTQFVSIIYILYDRCLLKPTSSNESNDFDKIGHFETPQFWGHHANLGFDRTLAYRECVALWCQSYGGWFVLFPGTAYASGPEELAIFFVGIWLNQDCGWKKCGEINWLMQITFDSVISMHFLYAVCLIRSSNVSWMEDFIPSITLLSRSSPIPTTIAMRAQSSKFMKGRKSSENLFPESSCLKVNVKI